MCGIITIFSTAGPIDKQRLQAACDHLRHRGPDAEGIWIADHQRVGLGHRRLSIVDLTTGNQPIANEDNTIHIVANGMFYDFHRIRSELQQSGHVFRTASDSEIALHLYEQHGIDCLQYLRGEFAFILWDDTQQRLLAARDRFGIKPLVYSHNGDTLCLASEAKALFAAGIPAKWDMDAFFQHLFVCLPQDKTLFEGILQVPPGHYLVADSKGYTVNAYWDLDYPADSDLTIEYDGTRHITELSAALDDAVKLRLAADVPVGCYLSGGIDSSAVSGMAVGHYANPIDAFTICFDTDAFNEEKVAQKTCFKLGARFNPIHMGNHDITEHFADTICAFEMLAENAHWVARYLLSRHVHEKGLKTVLAGEGGDEIFGGYEFLRREMLNGAANPPEQQDSSARHIDALLSQSHLAAHSFSPQYITETIGFTPFFLQDLAKNRRVFSTILHPDVLNHFKTRNPFETFLRQFDPERTLHGRHRMHQALYLWSKSVFPNYILAAEKLDMAHAVDVRLPILDHHVFAQVKQIPPTVLMKNGVEKSVLRETARPYITPTVYRRKKHAFIAPHLMLKQSDLFYTYAQDMLRGSLPDDIGIFDGRAIRNMLDGLFGLDDYLRLIIEPVLLMTLSACILHERYIGRTSN